ncbi:YobA family protein [Cytobacillus sp. Hz8]|uniref:YobA family protein n=1 Tax=Cytobacillus sp. Hz8 TaxID=3347168 RepID=UPI0035DF70C5
MIFRASLITLFSIILFGCDIKEKEDKIGSIDERVTNFSIEGYIMKKQGDRILVVRSQPKDFSSTSGKEEFYEAIWVSDITNEVELGQKVRVWIDGPIMESYPAQAKADKVIPVIADNQIGADLSEEEVIRKALSSERENVKDFFLPVIKSVTFDKESDSWKVEIKDEEGTGVTRIVIQDKR